MSLHTLLSVAEKKLLVKEKMPLFIPPMLAQLTHVPFSDSAWIYERKLDGERCLLFRTKDKTTLKSRNDNVVNFSYPEIVQEADKIDMPSCILDGEVVAMKKNVTDFSLLQSRFGSTVSTSHAASPIYYYVFDILYYNGYLVTHLPLLTRKALLKDLIPFGSVIRYVEHDNEKGVQLFKKACRNKWEGLIAKKNDSTYVSRRSGNWLKFKCTNAQEFVIGGYTTPGGLRDHFGALLVGYYENNKLKYAGKVGTGFNEETLQTLGALLKKYKIKSNPFDNYDISTRGVHWVRPILVCEIRFAEWTVTNKLRHSSYQGLRRDKEAKRVVKEG